MNSIILRLKSCTFLTTVVISVWGSQGLHVMIRKEKELALYYIYIYIYIYIHTHDNWKSHFNRKSNVCVTYRLLNKGYLVESWLAYNKLDCAGHDV